MSIALPAWWAVPVRRTGAVMRLIRIHNGLLAAAGVLVGAWWVGGPVFQRPVLLAAVAAIALAAFANSLNDYFDVRVDLVAHPQRPLPSGDLRPSHAVAVALTAALVAIVASFASFTGLGVMTGAVLVVMAAYDAQLKRSGAVGNYIVALLASLPFLYGGWSAGAPGPALALVGLAVPLHFAREVAKDLDDVAGDSGVRRTLPLVIGRRAAASVVVAALLVFVAVLVPFAVARPRFGLLVLPAVGLCAAAGWLSFRERGGSPVLLKAAMIAAITALVLGAG